VLKGVRTGLCWPQEVCVEAELFSYVLVFITLLQVCGPYTSQWTIYMYVSVCYLFVSRCECTVCFRKLQIVSQESGEMVWGKSFAFYLTRMFYVVATLETCILKVSGSKPWWSLCCRGWGLGCFTETTQTYDVIMCRNKPLSSPLKSLHAHTWSYSHFKTRCLVSAVSYLCVVYLTVLSNTDCVKSNICC
jgi:hypothetical protein